MHNTKPVQPDARRVLQHKLPRHIVSLITVLIVLIIMASNNQTYDLVSLTTANHNIMCQLKNEQKHVSYKHHGAETVMQSLTESKDGVFAKVGMKPQ